jgi:hypothetical protein
MDNAATGEADGKGFIVGVTKRHDATWLFASQDCKCFCYNGAFNAPTAD